MEEYQTELSIRLLPVADEKLPPLGPRNIRNVKRADVKAHFNALRNSGCTVSQVNKSIKVANAVFTYAFDLGYVTSNIMHRFLKLMCVRECGFHCSSAPRFPTATCTRCDGRL